MTLSFTSFTRVALANAACTLILALLANGLAAEDATAPAAASDATAPAAAAPAGEAGEKGEKGKKKKVDTARSLVEKLSQWSNLLDAKEGDKKAEEKWEKFETGLNKRPDDFNAIDADKDGKISKEELQAAFDKTAGELKDKFADTFAAIDTDKNGALSKAELNAYGAAQRKAAKEAKEGNGANPPTNAPAPAKDGESATPAATK